MDSKNNTITIDGITTVLTVNEARNFYAQLTSRRKNKPRRNETVYVLDSDGKIRKCGFMLNVSEDCYNQGNLRKSKQDIEYVRMHRIAVQKIKEWKADNNVEFYPTSDNFKDITNGVYTIVYDFYKKTFRSIVTTNSSAPACGFFRDGAYANQCIKACFPYLKALWGSYYHG